MLGLCNLAICAPIHWFMLRPVADDAAGMTSSSAGGALSAPLTAAVPDEQVLPSPASASGKEAMARALVHPAFWGLVVSFTCYYATFAAMTFHLVPLLTARHMPTATIVLVMAMIGPAQVLARVMLLSLGRRLHAATAGQVTVVAFPLSILLLMLFPASVPMLLLAMLIYGGANGMLTIIRGTAVPDLLWQEGYGSINGAIGFPSNMAKALGPLGAALVWAAGSNYNAVLAWVLAISTISAVAFRYAVTHAATRVNPDLT